MSASKIESEIASNNLRPSLRSIYLRQILRLLDINSDWV